MFPRNQEEQSDAADDANDRTVIEHPFHIDEGKAETPGYVVMVAGARRRTVARLITPPSTPELLLRLSGAHLWPRRLDGSRKAIVSQKTVWLGRRTGWPVKRR